MKALGFVILIAALLPACDKPVESDLGFTELNFVQTNTPTQVSASQNIVSSVRVSGPNLCYRLEYFTINQQQYLLEIHAIGSYPANTVNCAQAIYNKDTALSIPATVAGKYVLRFYNGNQLFKADTVNVN